jgi:hypothetical protein
MSLSITALATIVLIVILLSVANKPIVLSRCGECRYAERRYAEHRYAERRYAECHYAECHKQLQSIRFMS